MKKNYILNAFFLIIILISSSSQAESNLIPVIINDNNGYFNITLPIHSYSHKEKEETEIIGTGTIEGDSAQIKLTIAPNQAPERNGVTHTHLACELKIDENLFQFLAKRFSLTFNSKRTTSHTFDIVIDKGSLERINQAPLTLQLIDLENDENYSEWYVTIDVPKRILTLSEKNPQYRESFMKAFIAK